jgi:DNA recombination protein RmuC
VAIITSFIAALVGAAFIWLWKRGAEATHTERLRMLESSVVKADSELSLLRSDVVRLSSENTELSTKLSAERQAHERLSNEFKALASDALKANSQSFMDQAKQAFEQLQQQSVGDLEKRKDAVDNLVKPIRESLEKVDAKILEIDKNREKHFGALEKQLESLATAQTSLQTEATKLSTVLPSKSASPFMLLAFSSTALFSPSSVKPLITK